MITRNRRRVVANFASLTLLSGLLATSADAAAVSSTDPNSVVSALQEAGYKAKLSTDKDGKPHIESAADGTVIAMVFEGCTDKSLCTQIELIAAWTCDGIKKKCATQTEKWNGEENYSHALFFDDTVALYHHLLFDKVGYSSELFVTNLEFFIRDMAAFQAGF